MEPPLGEVTCDETVREVGRAAVMVKMGTRCRRGFEGDARDVGPCERGGVFTSEVIAGIDEHVTRVKARRPIRTVGYQHEFVGRKVPHPVVGSRGRRVGQGQVGAAVALPARQLIGRAVTNRSGHAQILVVQIGHQFFAVNRPEIGMAADGDVVADGRSERRAERRAELSVIDGLDSGQQVGDACRDG